MAGRRTSGGRAERSSEDEAFFRARATRSGAASGSSTGTARKRRKSETEIRTRPTVRLLTLRGLAPSEAANLTAYLCGLPVADCRWELRELNELLFLRELNRTGRFGASDGAN